MRNKRWNIEKEPLKNSGVTNASLTEKELSSSK
jgi:hypothetical protein